MLCPSAVKFKFIILNFSGIIQEGRGIVFQNTPYKATCPLYPNKGGSTKTYMRPGVGRM
jgi:hypothetical protein